ncbi:hypothetical protein [Rickettsiella endosymbiont of Xylota segnis]|uniref:hypothetical protein n=1 Tax=Rickettsiella endosymbiont of Xylota segnis TaxID=3066238 RepID=UPI0030D13B4F
MWQQLENIEKGIKALIKNGKNRCEIKKPMKPGFKLYLEKDRSKDFINPIEFSN